MKLFVGLGVSLEKTAICVISEHGKIVREAQAASEPEVPIRWISEQDGAIAAVGLEAGPLSQWLHRGLSDAGLPVVLMETRQVKGALKAMPIKTDRRDAEGIARLLHLGWFRPVHRKSVSTREVRAVLSARKAVQQGFITLEMSLRGLLRNFGLKVGTISCGRFEQRIRERAAGNPMLEAATEPMLRARSALRRELAGLERNVRQLAQEDPVCRRLMSMPGIGAVVALTYRSAVDDPARFTSSKKVGPWVGLTPSRDPIWRARRLGRRHQGWRRQPAARVVSGCDRHDAPWAFDLAENMGRAGCAPPWRKVRHGRPGTTHWGDPSQDVG
jgi:transposase